MDQDFVRHILLLKGILSVLSPLYHFVPCALTTGIVGSGGTAGEAGLTGVDGGNGGYNARGESGEIGPPRSGGSVLGPPGGDNFTLRIFNVDVFVLTNPRW